MKRVAAVALVGAIFLAGLAAGVAGTHIYYSSHMQRVGGPRGWMAHRFEARLDHDLALTEEQRRQIRRIVEESRRESEELRREVLPQVRGVVEGAADEILAVLTPEQRRKFESLSGWERRRLEFFLMGPGPPGPPGDPPLPQQRRRRRP